MAEPVTLPAPAPRAAKLAARLKSPFLLRGFMLAKLPLALVAGLRVRELDPERCVVTVPYGWRTTNPFRSTYFAALSMAAEMSTGALAMLATELEATPVALIIVDLQASFEKKAQSLTAFTCEEGRKAFDAVAETVRTGEPATARMETVGRSPDGTVVARFAFTWSFKRRSQK
jgi:acyl-coenzyme A thioesterase PaaI-like protein